VYIDHSVFKQVVAKKDPKPPLLQWIIILQEFALEIQDKKGTENVVADHLSLLLIPLGMTGSMTCQLMTLSWMTICLLD